MIVSPQMTESGRTSSVDVRPSHEDPSGLREIQSRLFQAERMASLGTLAAGIAHEVNNPLTYVLANLGFIVEQMESIVSRGGEPELETLLLAARDAHEGAERVRVVIRDMHAVSRGDIDKIVPTDVHAAIDAAIRVTSHAMRRRAAVQKIYRNVPPVLGNEGLLVQAFMNLLVNAAQAMGSTSGRVIVSTQLSASGMVVIEVEDNGEGIDRMHKDRIFDPFFTTRSSDGATGLGLFTVKGIAGTLNGSIECESEPGQGALFRLSLPAVLGQTVDAEPSKPRTGRKLRVLLVDDEPQVRAALARLLTDHEVAYCSDGERALALSRSNHFDVLLSDLVMPGMSGRELHERLRREDHPLAAHTVFLTGGALDPDDAVYIRGGTCLYKPVDREALLDALEAAAK